MQAVGPENTFMAIQPQEPKEEPVTVDRSQSLWDYRNRNTYNGMPVAPQARNLMVDNADQLNRALQPKGTSGVWVGYISPLDEDKQYLDSYAKLKEQETQGSIFILQENKQFCPSLNKILVFITYLKVQMDLNPRYEHLKEDKNGE